MVSDLIKFTCADLLASPDGFFVGTSPSGHNLGTGDITSNGLVNNSGDIIISNSLA